MADNSVLGPLIGLWRRFFPDDLYAEKQDRNLDRLEALLGGGRVLDKDLSTPPGSPADGDGYIVKATGLGAWAGHDKALAFWFATTFDVPAGEWIFIPPHEGTFIWVADEALLYVYTSGAWAKLTASPGGPVGGGGAGLGLIMVPLNPVSLSGWSYRSGGAGGQTYAVHGSYNGGGGTSIGISSFAAPADFGSFASAKLWYIQNGTSGNHWVFKLGMYKNANGADASGAATYGTQKEITPPTTTDQTHVVSLTGGEIPALSPAPGDIVTVQMQRLSGDAADTNTNEMALQGLVIYYNRA